jgi:hypothetical protein
MREAPVSMAITPVDLTSIVTAWTWESERPPSTRAVEMDEESSWDKEIWSVPVLLVFSWVELGEGAD